MKKTSYLVPFLYLFLSSNLSAQKQDPVIDQDNPLKAQVIVQDLVVQGSECVGIDCASSESFGFDTERYKENNLRIHFDDTSNSASFPSNDWRIEINSSANGGASYFAIQDATASRTPFIIEAGAPTDALRVDNSGRLGIGTASPVVEVHVADGDSPTLRLEQNGSSGFTPQTWDIAGNETNFFVRDVTNGSKLPFKIKPGAPDNALFVAASGTLGINTASPDANKSIHAKHSGATIKIEDTNTTNGGRVLVDMVNKGPTRLDMTNTNVGVAWRSQVDNNGKYKLGLADAVTHMEINNVTGNVGFGVSPTSALHVKRTDGTASINIEEGITTNGGRVLLNLSNFGPTRIDMNNTNAGITWRGQVDNQGRYKLGIADGLGVLTLDDANGNMTVTGTVTANSVLLTSDLRLKTNVSKFDGGLDEVLKINPINYEFNGKGGFETNKPYVGYGAQELEEIASYLVQDFEIEKEDSNGDIKSSQSYLKIDPIAVQALLVNAIKDQNEIINEKEERIGELEGQMSELKSQMDEIMTLLKGNVSHDVTLNGTESLLKQNYPNPHKGETVIEYFIPEYTKSGQIQIFDISGKLIKNVSINKKGSGQVNLSSNNIPNGQYTYSLLLDGKVASTKKMTLAK